MTLTFDSLLSDAAGVRGPGSDSPRMLVFDGEDLTIEIEVGSDVLMGQIVPGRSEQVIVETADGHVDEATADDAGFFLLRRPAQRTDQAEVADRSDSGCCHRVDLGVGRTHQGCEQRLVVDEELRR